MNIDSLIRQQEFEDFFQEHEGWISAKTICDLFHVNERALRGEHSPIRPFVISSDAGYKSIFHASDEEFNVYCNRIRSHAIEELRRVQYLRKKRVSEWQLIMEAV